MFSVSVNLPLPLIRSYRIEFYFSVAAARRPGAPVIRMSGKLASQPSGPAGPFVYMARTATAFTERRYGTAVRTRFYRNGYGNGYGWTETYDWKPGM